MAHYDTLVPLPGSEKSAPEGTQLSTLKPTDVFEVTVRVNRRQPIDALVTTEAPVAQPLSQSQYTRRFGGDPATLRAVEAYLHTHGLSTVLLSAARRSVIVRGTVEQFSAAFGVSLANYKAADGSVFRGRSGPVLVPTELLDLIEGVFGLDDRPAAVPHFQVFHRETDGIANPRAVSASFNPNQLAQIYNFPTGVTGKGQRIAIIELGGGFRQADITAYFKSLGLKAPLVKAVSVDGGVNSPGNANSADGEVMLDIEVAGAVAPGAQLIVYFAPNTDKGFLDAITTALHDTVNKPSVISISWGAAERNWTPQSLTTFNQAFQGAAALGITVCAAAGDTGSGDSVTDGKAHVDFPASSPFVLACGGTNLKTNGNTITAETVWHVSNDSATGGGISDAFDKPDYQTKANVPPSVNDGKRIGRGLPDVSAVADPSTGYNVRVDGKNLVIGGTSAVAPLMAGLVALFNEKRKKPVGFLNPVLYANPAVCRDITQGDNITVAGNKGYVAQPGWDGATGLGVVDGQKLAKVLGG